MSIHHHMSGGRPGSTPPDRQDPVPTANAGLSGIGNVTEIHFGDIAPHISPTYLFILLNSASRHYLNGQFSDAAYQLLFVKGLVLGAEGLPAAQAPADGDKARYDCCGKKASALLRQLNQHLDYYGDPLNHITLLSVNYYQNLLPLMLKYGSVIEKAFIDYFNEQHDQKVAAAAFSQAKAHRADEIGRLAADSASIAAAQPELTKAIDRLGENLEFLWQELQDADRQFKADVLSVGGGCDLSRLLAIGAAVSTLVASGGTDAAAIGEAVGVIASDAPKDDRGKPIGDDWAGAKYKISKVVTAGQDTASFLNAFNQLIDKLSKKNEVPELSKLPSDEGKIIASASAIQEQLMPYKTLRSAQRYSALIDSFVQTAEARNNKILEYDNGLLRISQNDADISRYNLEGDSAQTAFAQSRDPFVAEAEAFMHNAWIASKKEIVRAVYEMQRACNYYSLRTPLQMIDDFSMDSLSRAALAALTDYKNARDSFGSDPSDVHVVVDLRPYMSAAQWKRLRGGMPTTIAIARTDPQFANLSYVQATRVWLELETLTEKVRTFSATITHEGRALIRDQLGVWSTFSHQPVPVPYGERDGFVTVNGEFAGAGGAHSDYAGLTPFGPWTLTLNEIDPSRLRHLRVARMGFEGKGRGSLATH